MTARSRLLPIALSLVLALPAGATTPRCSPPPGHDDGTTTQPPPPPVDPPPPPPPPMWSPSGPRPPELPSIPDGNRAWRPGAVSTSPILSQQIVDGDEATPAAAWMAGHAANYQTPPGEPVGGPAPPPEAIPTSVGSGEACQLLQIPRATTTGADTSPFYTESLVATLAPGRSLALRMKVDASRFADAAGPADIDFVELDLERDDFAALLPLRLSLRRDADGALQLSFRNAGSARVYHAHALRRGDVDVGIRWTALPRGQLAVTLSLDGQPVAQQILRGQVVALRIGLLDARGAIDTSDLVRLDRVRIGD